MEVTLSLIILAASVVVTSAKSLPEGHAAMEQEKERVLQEFYRDRRSQYPQYASPCAAAAASSVVSAIAPAVAPAAYQVNMSPYHQYPAPMGHGYYGAPHYRSFEFEPEQEMMSYSDMDHIMPEHIPMARYGYATPTAPQPSFAVPTSSAGPAYGIFPNAKIGGCSVPLLFSCSPSVVPGHVVQQPQSYGNSYRGVELVNHNVQGSHAEEPAVQEHLTPVHETTHTSQTAVHQ